MTRRTYEKPTLVREEMLQFVVAFGLTRGDKATNGLENGNGSNGSTNGNGANGNGDIVFE